MAGIDFPARIKIDEQIFFIPSFKPTYAIFENSKYNPKEMVELLFSVAIAYRNYSEITIGIEGLYFYSLNSPTTGMGVFIIF